MKFSDIDKTRGLPTEDDVEAALNFLAETDKEWGRLHGAVLSAEYLYKQVLARQFDYYDGSIADRENKAKSSTEAITYAGKHVDAVTSYRILSARRKTAELNIDVWRSVNAARRQGS